MKRNNQIYSETKGYYTYENPRNYNTYEYPRNYYTYNDPIIEYERMKKEARIKAKKKQRRKNKLKALIADVLFILVIALFFMVLAWLTNSDYEMEKASEKYYQQYYEPGDATPYTFPFDYNFEKGE